VQQTLSRFVSQAAGRTLLVILQNPCQLLVSTYPAIRVRKYLHLDEIELSGQPPGRNLVPGIRGIFVTAYSCAHGWKAAAAAYAA